MTEGVAIPCARNIIDSVVDSKERVSTRNAGSFALVGETFLLLANLTGYNEDAAQTVEQTVEVGALTPTSATPVTLDRAKCHEAHQIPRLLIALTVVHILYCLYPKVP